MNKQVVWLLLCISFFVGLPVYGSPKAVESVILDTDMGPDIDDAAALAVLHKLADYGEAEILAVVACNEFELSPVAIDVVNTYYGRGEIPIGVIRSGPDINDVGYKGTVEQFGHDYNEQASVGAVELYRRILAGAEPDSITIIATGFQSNLANLLNSRGDKYSDLDGRELVNCKVKKLVVMGGRYPGPAKSWNFKIDGPAAREVAEHWPAKLVYTGLGKEVMTGSKLVARGKNDNPVRSIYASYFQKKGLKNRPSWDQIAVLYGVRGTGKWFREVKSGRNHIETDGTNRWLDERKANHSYLQCARNPEELAEYIEKLMLEAPEYTLKGSKNSRIKP